MKQYKKYWGDMHSNLHHEDIHQLESWFSHVKKCMDFWPIAYYPFYMRRCEQGLDLEDIYSTDICSADWENIRIFTERVNKEGYPMFMGYEWQGCGQDGDHNVFFLDNNQDMKHPMRYKDLCELYAGEDVIAIPHHLAYQPESRGKNWSTHNEKFSPFAEIYSSHGSSENDYGPIGMNRHIHMGPRTGQTCYEEGLNYGYKIGVIAAGDNHNVPAVYEHGAMCVLAEDNTKEKLWEAFVNRRTYGVSQSHIQVDFTANDQTMGEVVKADKIEMKFHIEGSDSIDRIEILKDNVLEEMVVHSGTWERNPYPETVRIKFKIEFGWGPDTRVFPDITKKVWHGSLYTNGRLCSIEKCWNNFGQELYSVTEKGCEFQLTTYKSASSGRWMGSSNIVTEGFIFEVETLLDEDIKLVVDKKEYKLNIKDMLNSSRILPLYEESKNLINDRYGPIKHYRNDPWWHNAYKIKISQAVLSKAYTVDYKKNITIEKNCNFRLRIWQKNGHTAWTSPIFVEKERR